MGSGKNIYRLVSCGYWAQYVEKDENFCSYRILDNDGNVVTKEQVKDLTFCHLQLVFNNNADIKYLDLLSSFLKVIVDVGEHFAVNIEQSYHFNFINIY